MIYDENAFEAERDVANMEELWKYVKISQNDAAKWLGLSVERLPARRKGRKV